MNTPIYLTPDELHASLTVRDLSDPAQGAHAMQNLLHGVVDSLQQSWNCTTRTLRNPPIVSIRDNYDSLQYQGNDVTRARRYTRYLSPTTMLRSHTSAELPQALHRYKGRTGVDELLAVPGLVYRRDVVDRTHVGEPHQVDLWRIRSTPHTTPEDLHGMIGTLVDAVLPGGRVENHAGSASLHHQRPTDRCPARGRMAGTGRMRANPPGGAPVCRVGSGAMVGPGPGHGPGPGADVAQAHSRYPLPAGNRRARGPPDAGLVSVAAGVPASRGATRHLRGDRCRGGR